MSIKQTINRLPGKFITIEGSEGSGKSTNIALLESFLNQQGIEVVLTREPGGTQISEKIRDLLLDKNNTALCTDSELLLMFAARAQHIQELIIPSLEQGKWVISDRFTDASFAYQGGARGLGFERISVLRDWVQGGLSPDLTLLFDLSVEIGMERAKKRGPSDRFEQEKLDFFEKVRRAYLELADMEPKRFEIIDASQSIEAVKESVIGAIKSRLL